jgi:16S rRNA (guanine(966)-N(2))-methyltransferase RsmD
MSAALVAWRARVHCSESNAADKVADAGFCDRSRHARLKLPKRNPQKKTNPHFSADQSLRVIGGNFRGRKLQYHGDPRTRPMKERVREAVFNLLGPAIVDKHVIDLFAGTGALGLEAISRGARSATFVEQHFPTADLIRQNIKSLGVEACCEVAAGDTFLWSRRELELPDGQAVVLSSPPYDFYIDRRDEMLALVQRFIDRAHTGWIFVVEADERFDFGDLPDSSNWDVRPYPPAVVGMLTVK